MIDTNIFISAALFPNGRVAAALMKALMPPYEPVVCDYVVDELHRKFREKFPDKMVELEAFLFAALQSIEVIPIPGEEAEAELKIRDIKDRPILRAALGVGADFSDRSKNHKCKRFPGTVENRQGPRRGSAIPACFIVISEIYIE